MKTLLTCLIGFAALGCSPCHAQDRALLDRYCVGCHNEKTRSGNLAIDKLDFAHPGNNAETWEKVIRKIRAGMMPPSRDAAAGSRHSGRFCHQVGTGAG